MPKYYVRCGNFKLVISRETPILAAMAAIRAHIKKIDSSKLSDLFSIRYDENFFNNMNTDQKIENYPDLTDDINVSEEGFSDEAKCIEAFETKEVMKKNMLEDFKNFGK